MSGEISTISLILFILCFFLSAFFSSSEAAFLSLQKVRIRHLVSKGVAGAGRVARMSERPDRLLATVLVGNNFVNTAAAALGTAMSVSLLGSQRGVLVATVAVTVLLLVFGEVVPKTIGIKHSERMTFLYVRPLEWVERVVFPFAVVLRWLSGGISSLLRGGKVPKSLVSDEELRTVISIGREEGVVEPEEAAMMHKVLDFGDRRVREVMTPRLDLVWVEKGTTLSEFLSIYSRHSHTRFPVYDGSPDNVVGILSTKDVVKAIAEGKITGDQVVTELVRPAYFVPETKYIGELFTEMRSKGTQMAMVVDEYGGIAGLVTLRHMVEEIVGRVDVEVGEAQEFVAIDERTYQLDAGMRIDEANEQLGLNLPEGDYETVAGFVLNLLGHIPREGEQLRYNGLRVVVSKMQGVKIEKVMVTRL